MSQSKREFTIFDKKILIFLYNSRIERSTSEIANELGMSWATANKYLNILCDEAHLVKRQEGNRVYWMYWQRFLSLPEEEMEKWWAQWSNEARAVLNLPSIKKYKQTTLDKA